MSVGNCSPQQCHGLCKIRQPGSQTEIIWNCIRHRPEAEPNQSCQHELSVGSLLYCTTSLCLFTMSGRKRLCGFILRFEKTVVPGKTGCKAKCMFEVLHFRMP